MRVPRIVSLLGLSCPVGSEWVEVGQRGQECTVRGFLPGSHILAEGAIPTLAI